MMKKLIILSCLLLASFTCEYNTLFAQATETNISAPLDAKTQKKVDKATIDLAKDKQKLNKSVASYDKSLAKFEKDQSKGKLSPNAVVKEKKAQEKAQKNIAKLKKSIADNESFLAKYFK